MAGHSALSRRELLAGLGALGALALAPRARAASSFTLKNATVLTHEGRRLDGHGVRVENGVIAEIAAGLGGADAVDLGGGWLAPGFTDAGCTVGLWEVDLEDTTHDDAPGTDAICPDARARDGYNPRSVVIPVTRANGITAVLVQPAAGHLISGQAALFRLTGDTVADALVQAPSALCINLGRAAGGEGGGPNSRIAVGAKLRATLDAVKLPEEAAAAPEQPTKGKKKKEDGGGAPDVPDDKDLSAADLALRDLRRGKLPALIQAERADDLLAAIDLVKTYKLRAILLGAAEGHLVARAIADAGLPVFLGPLMVQPDSFDHLYARYENAAILHAAGVRLAFRTGSNHHARMLPTHAGTLVAHGLPYEAAIAALTSNAGAALGIARYGQLAVGAEATFFQVDGDPLQPRFPVRRLWIAGQEQSMENRQTRLYEQYRTLR